MAPVIIDQEKVAAAKAKMLENQAKCLKLIKDAEYGIAARESLHKDNPKLASSAYPPQTFLVVKRKANPRSEFMNVMPGVRWRIVKYGE